MVAIYLQKAHAADGATAQTLLTRSTSPLPMLDGYSRRKGGDCRSPARVPWFTTGTSTGSSPWRGSAFLDADAEVAAQRRHLTARQAGDIAKRASVSRFVPLHFSARYRDQDDRLRSEGEEAFRDKPASHKR
jgi:hypothetical protein